jgi:hypothetical protein
MGGIQIADPDPDYIGKLDPDPDYFGKLVWIHI